MKTQALDSSSSSAQGATKFGERTRLPLVPCSDYGEEILELVCGPGSKVPGAIFFKCRLHERDVPGTCPWILFANKYRKMLIGKGIIDHNGTVLANRTELAVLPQVDQLRIGQVEANRTELAPLLDDVVSLKNGAHRVDEKLQKLIVIGKIATLCLIVVVVFVVVGVIIMSVK